MQIIPDQIDPDAAKVVLRLRRFDHAAYVVGGCVRDLLLGRKPKDFDVATSATPNEIRRLFRNCRIIGRRFRLAHIFFGSKIIETVHLPRQPARGRGRDRARPAPRARAQDLLIRRDNVFGTAEEDARRRDFTINGLFYDLETGQVIDYVNGMADLRGAPGAHHRRSRHPLPRGSGAHPARREVRRPLQPDHRARDLPAHAGARRRDPEVRPGPRLRGVLPAAAGGRGQALDGAAARDHPAARCWCPAAATTAPRTDGRRRRREAAPDPSAGCWAYLAALDRSTAAARLAALERADPGDAAASQAARRPAPRHQQHPRHRSARLAGDRAHRSSRCRASRRDSELARQILLAMRYIFPVEQRAAAAGPRFAGREFLDDALRLHEIVSDAEALEPELAGRPLLAEGEAARLSAEAEERLARELETPSEFERRRGRAGRERRAGAPRPRRARRRAAGAGGDPSPTAVGGRTPHPRPGPAWARPPSAGPAFLGTGAFGGRWNTPA